MKRVQWFDADRRLSNEVAEFMRCYVWKAELKLRYGKKIQDCKDGLEKLNVLVGSIHEDKIPEMREGYLAQIATLEQELADEIEKTAKFELSEAAKEFKKSINKNPASADLALVVFFRNYGLDIVGTYLIDEILDATGEKIDNKTIVNSGATITTKFNVANCLKMLYAKTYEHMVQAGTIKPQQIPEMMMDKYDAARVKARKAAKKGQKA